MTDRGIVIVQTETLSIINSRTILGTDLSVFVHSRIAINQAQACIYKA